MTLYFTNHLLDRFVGRSVLVAFLLLFGLPIGLRAQQHEDFDQYKLRIETSWFYSYPSGTIQGSSDQVPVDLQKSFGFSTYSTFSGKIDWKFTRKNHIYLATTPFYSSRQTVVQQQFIFRGQTFVAGLSTQSELRAFLVAPGYQYDIIRRKRGHLGLAVQVDLFNSTAKISAAAQVVGGTTYGPLSASGSLLAPLPVAGPQFRLYLTNSPRVFVDGNLYGMYFFGYGNFVSTADTLGVAVNKHFSLNAGYQLANRLVVKNSAQNDRIGLQLTQKGPVLGMKFSF